MITHPAQLANDQTIDLESIALTALMLAKRHELKILDSDEVARDLRKLLTAIGAHSSHGSRLIGCLALGAE